MEPKTDRRREPRVRVLSLVNVDQRDDAGELTELTVGRTLDLSQHGMRLELSRPLPLRSRVRLTVALSDRILTVDGQVRYVNELEEGRCAMGIQFVELSADAEAALVGFIDDCD